jgi:hypothetical protein
MNSSAVGRRVAPGRMTRGPQLQSPMIPPRAMQALICSSSMFLGLGTTALGLEWLKMQGWALFSMISRER